MRNRCFAIGIVVLAVACLSYVGYREFRQHLEFKEFIAKTNSLPVAELFPPKVVSTRIPPPPADLNAAVNFINHQMPGRTITTASGKKVKLRLSEFEIGKETIRVLPNGEMYSVYAPIGSLDTPAAWVIKPYDGILEGLDDLTASENAPRDTSPVVYHKDDVPAGEDPYLYGIKLSQAQARGLSIEEFDQKLANREIIIGNSYRIPITSQVKRGVGETRLPKQFPASPSELSQESEPSESEPIESINPEGRFDEDTPSVRSDVPHAPSDLPDMVKPQFPPSVAGIEKQLTPEGTEVELSKGISTDHFSKAQQLIDQYGTKEGLRRLREMDPDAARQFEQGRRPVPSRDVPDGVQSESGSKD